jgi:hypothetical protein
LSANGPDGSAANASRKAENSAIRDSANPGRALDSHNRQGAPRYRPPHPDVRADPQSAGKRTEFMSTLLSTACCEDADPATTAVEPIARDRSSQQAPCCPRRRRSPSVVSTAQNRRICMWSAMRTAPSLGRTKSAIGNAWPQG